VSPDAIVAAGSISIALVVGTAVLTDEISFLGSLFSFGVLAAFTAAQLAVIRLRFTEPDLRRPFRAPLDVRIRGVDVPLPAIVGSVLTFAVFVMALVTHAGARYGGPVWLAAGLVGYGLGRRARGEGVGGRVGAPPRGAAG